MLLFLQREPAVIRRLMIAELEQGRTKMYKKGLGGAVITRSESDHSVVDRFRVVAGGGLHVSRQPVSDFAGGHAHFTGIQTLEFPAFQ